MVSNQSKVFLLYIINHVRNGQIWKRHRFSMFEKYCFSKKSSCTNAYFCSIVNDIEIMICSKFKCITACDSTERVECGGTKEISVRWSSIQYFIYHKNYLNENPLLKYWSCCDEKSNIKIIYVTRAQLFRNLALKTKLSSILWASAFR